MDEFPIKSKAYYFTATLLATIAVYPLLTIYLSIFFISDNKMEELIMNPIFGFSILFFMVAAPSFLTYRSKKHNTQRRLEYYTITILCYVIGYIMLFYGADKLVNKQFVVFYKGLDTKLNDVDSYTLTWYYYGRSNVQVFIMGLLEVIPSLLLLFRKTRFVGAITMLPVVMNVLVTNIFNRISPFTLFAISLLTIFNLFIIYSYKNEIRELIRKINSTRNPSEKTKRSIILFKIVFWGFILITGGLKTASYFKSRSAFLYGNGAYALTALKIDGKPVSLDSVPATWYKKIYKEKDRRFTTIVNGKDSTEGANVIFYPAHDSIRIAATHYADYDYIKENANTVFKGSYQLTDNHQLLLKGKQNNSLIEAVYRKLPFKDYNWWW